VAVSGDTFVIRRQERLIVARRLEQINQIALDAEPGFVDVLDIDQKAVRAMPVETASLSMVI
jgi:hypothetical protein